MLLKNLTHHLETLAPLAWQEEWDNSGLQLGNLEKNIKTIVLALDIDSKTVNFARDKNADLIITHHPMFFAGIKSLNHAVHEQKNIMDLVQSEIHVYSMHTNLDAAPWGVNYSLAKAFELDNKITPYVLTPHGLTIKEALLPTWIPNREQYVGRQVGLVQLIRQESQLEHWYTFAKALAQGHIQCNFSEDKIVQKIALSGGSWDGTWNLATVEQDIHLIITGEMKYHDSLYFRERGIAVICLGHYLSEYFVLEDLGHYISNILAQEKEETHHVHVYSGQNYYDLESV